MAKSGTFLQVAEDQEGAAPRLVTEFDGLPIRAGFVSSSNSTTTALADAATFTGGWEDVAGFDSVVIAAKTDQDGYFTTQFSPDGVNIDSTLTRQYRTAQIEAPHRFTITRRYVRVTFTNNSGSAQTYLRLQTMYGSKAELNAPTDSVLAQDFDATVTRPTNFIYEVALSRRQGWNTWNKWGYNGQIDATTATVWSAGGTFVRMPTAATLDVTSSSVNDTAAGTGAQSIVITGVDANYDEVIEVVALNGTTIVTTTNSYLGVNRMAVYAAGSGGFNDGTINAVVTTGGTTQAQIPANEGSTQQAIFFVPRAHTALMDWMYLNVVKTSGGGKPLVTFKVFVVSLVSGATYEVFRDTIDVALENHLELTPSQPFVVGEKSLIYLQATTDTTATACSGRFSLVTVRAVTA